MAAAAKIVQCISSPSNQELLAQQTGAVPSLLSLANSVAQSNSSLAPFVTVVAGARARTALLGPNWPAAATKIYTAEQLALTGKLSPSAALAQAQSQTQ
jgi:multiple sugar transport system substrate-binding protein